MNANKLSKSIGFHRAWPCLFILFMALINAACSDESKKDKTMLPLPIKPGSVIDKNSEYVKTWPGKPALYKLNEKIIIQMPPQFQGFWRQTDWLGRSTVPRAPMSLDKLEPVSNFSFSMFMPDFSGFTPENYQVDFHPDQVEIRAFRPESMRTAEPMAPGAYAPNVIARVQEIFEIDTSGNFHGLRCYKIPPEPKEGGSRTCFGKSGSGLNEQLILDIELSPYPSWTLYPLMQARYFSKKYGGVEILWRARMKHFSHWHEIDRQIWKYIAEWNLVPQ